MKGLEQMRVILLRDADAFVANDADHVASVARHKEVHRCPFFGILHRVAEQVAKNLGKQPFVSPAPPWELTSVRARWNSSGCRGENLVHNSASLCQPT